MNKALEKYQLEGTFLNDWIFIKCLYCILSNILSEWSMESPSLRLGMKTLSANKTSILLHYRHSETKLENYVVNKTHILKCLKNNNIHVSSD